MDDVLWVILQCKGTHLVPCVTLTIAVHNLLTHLCQQTHLRNSNHTTIIRKWPHVLKKEDINRTHITKPKSSQKYLIVLRARFENIEQHCIYSFFKMFLIDYLVNQDNKRAGQLKAQNGFALLEKCWSIKGLNLHEKSTSSLYIELASEVIVFAINESNILELIPCHGDLLSCFQNE